MKNPFNKLFALCILLLVFHSTFSIAEEASKIVERSFTISSNTNIEIYNKFGNVVINKWDKDIVDLKVKIEARGSNESKMQKILDAIEIDITDRISSGSLKFETEIDDINGNSSFSIDYEVTMPDTNPMKLKNSFGSVYMGSYKGPLEVEVKYGQFQAEDIDQGDIRIDFSNSRCEIETLKSGDLDLRYSKMSIEQLVNVNVSSQFSDLEIEEAGVLYLNGKYGKLEIERVKVLKGDIQFAGLDIEYLEESIDLKNRHGDGINIEKISSDFKNIDIDGQFCSVKLTLEEKATAQLLFNLEFGNLKAYGDGINFDKVIKNHTSSEYEGYLGDKNATASIRINSRHGNIRLNVGE